MNLTKKIFLIILVLISFNSYSWRDGYEISDYQWSKLDVPNFYKPSPQFVNALPQFRDLTIHQLNLWQFVYGNGWDYRNEGGVSGFYIKAGLDIRPESNPKLLKYTHPRVSLAKYSDNKLIISNNIKNIASQFGDGVIRIDNQDIPIERYLDDFVASKMQSDGKYLSEISNYISNVCMRAAEEESFNFTNQSSNYDSCVGNSMEYVEYNSMILHIVSDISDSIYNCINKESIIPKFRDFYLRGSELNSYIEEYGYNEDDSDYNCMKMYTGLDQYGNNEIGGILSQRGRVMRSGMFDLTDRSPNNIYFNKNYIFIGYIAEEVVPNRNVSIKVTLNDRVSGISDIKDLVQITHGTEIKDILFNPYKDAVFAEMGWEPNDLISTLGVDRINEYYDACYNLNNNHHFINETAPTNEEELNELNNLFKEYVKLFAANGGSGSGYNVPKWIYRYDNNLENIIAINYSNFGRNNSITHRFARGQNYHKSGAYEDWVGREYRIYGDVYNTGSFTRENKTIECDNGELILTLENDWDITTYKIKDSIYYYNNNGVTINQSSRNFIDWLGQNETLDSYMKQAGVNKNNTYCRDVGIENRLNLGSNEALIFNSGLSSRSEVSWPRIPVLHKNTEKTNEESFNISCSYTSNHWEPLPNNQRCVYTIYPEDIYKINIVPRTYGGAEFKYGDGIDIQSEYRDNPVNVCSYD